MTKGSEACQSFKINDKAVKRLGQVVRFMFFSQK